MLDALAVFASASLAYIMTIGFDNYEITIELIVWCVCNVLLTIGFFSLFGMYSVILSNIGIIEALKLGFGVLCVTALNVLYYWSCRFNVFRHRLYKIFRENTFRRKVFCEEYHKNSETRNAGRRGFGLRNPA